MIKEELQKQAEQIEAIYQSYLDQLFELKKKQDAIIAEFSEALKDKKIELINHQLEKL